MYNLKQYNYFYFLLQINFIINLGQVDLEMRFNYVQMVENGIYCWHLVKCEQERTEWAYRA